MQEPSRRSVLCAGLGALGLMIVGVDGAVADAATPGGPVRHDYTPSVAKLFTVEHGGRTHQLRLTAVQNLPHTSAANRPYCFSLLFTPTGRIALPDGIYRLKRTGVPTRSLFLAGIGTGRTLQAVVSRAHG